ncbi:hypothetical protein QA640_24240 [Bradyrhizobium sp. CB82]|uniref:hypothetical protein n=1 Tax=Bradyrhizobium sp. CB82 TaxID=3039159 RepID=UPI0024B18D13|nr:hypothetical protein [Bradyrhizobium sp. CB82]WFU37586.1 hypothetical protein QA640_24240 [Bradyrhizobium sp. CB82]
MDVRINWDRFPYRAKMEPWTFLVRQHLAEAEQHVALGKRHIARQVEIIDELARAGHDTGLALDVLDSYRQLQVSHLAHRDHT